MTVVNLEKAVLIPPSENTEEMKKTLNLIQGFVHQVGEVKHDGKFISLKVQISPKSEAGTYHLTPVKGELDVYIDRENAMPDLTFVHATKDYASFTIIDQPFRIYYLPQGS